jgi:hypothetical protein
VGNTGMEVLPEFVFNVRSMDKLVGLQAPCPCRWMQKTSFDYQRRSAKVMRQGGRSPTHALPDR